VNRTEIGRREFGRATAGKGPAATGRVREASSVLADGVEEFIFADVFSRSGLPAREREMLTVAVLAAIGGADNQLGVHVPAALECGADAEELLQICEQIAPYAGFPRALNALRAVRAVLEDRGLLLPLAVSDVHLASYQTLVAETGAGDTGYLMLHAPELDRRMWREVMRALPDGRRAVAPDLRGAGAAVGAPVASDVGALVDDVVGVMDATGMARAVVVAQGASGPLALALAAAHPDRVARVVAISPRTRDVAVDPAPAELAGLMRAVTLAEDGWAARYARDRYRRVDLEGWRGLVGALAAVDHTASVPASVTVVCGDAGAPLDAAWASFPATLIPDAGDLVGLEAPGPLAAVLAGIS